MTVYFTTFSFTFTTLVQFANLKVCTFSTLLKKGNYCFFLKLNETDTSLDFLIVEKVAVSLPTKCLSNPTSGSVLIGTLTLCILLYIRRKLFCPGIQFFARVHLILWIQNGVRCTADT